MHVFPNPPGILWLVTHHHQQDLKYGLHDHFVHMVANVGTSKGQIATFDRNPLELYGKNTLMETSIYIYCIPIVGSIVMGVIAGWFRHV